MSNIDYTSLINGDEEVVDTPAMVIMSRSGAASETWTDMGGHSIFEETKKGSATRYKLSDNEFSTIGKRKEIYLSENQINLTQESYSQFIPFEMDRFQDGIDLAKGVILINYICPSNDSGEPDVEIASNAQYSESKIRFGWLIGPDVVQKPGTIEFEIEVVGAIKGTRNLWELDEATGKYKVTNGSESDQTYVWKTQRNSSLRVIESLGTGISTIDFPDDWEVQVGFAVSQAIATTLTDDYLKEQLGELKVDGESCKSVVDYVEKYVENKVGSGKLTDYVNRNNVTLSLDPTTYILTLGLGSGKTLTVDLPLESVVTSGSYDKTNKKLVLTLHNGVKVEIPVGDIIAGLVSSGDLDAAKTELETKIATDVAAVKTELEGKITTETTARNTAIAAVEAKFGDLGSHTEGEGDGAITVENTVKYYVDTAVASKDLSDYYTKEETYSKSEVDSAIENVDVTSQLNELKEEFDAKLDIDDGKTVKEYVAEQLEGIELDDYYTKTETNAAITNATATLSGLPSKVTQLEETVNAIDKSPRLTYDINIATDDTGKSFLEFYEFAGGVEDMDATEPKSKKELPAGTGGAGAGAQLSISYVTTTPVVSLKGDKVVIKYKAGGKDSSGDDLGELRAVWSVGGTVVLTEEISCLDASGELLENSFDVTKYLEFESQKVQLTVYDDNDNWVKKTWTVKIVDFSLTSSYNDTQKINFGKPTTFFYTVKGAEDKTVHFLLDGQELLNDDGEPLTKFYSSLLPEVTDSITIPAQMHGSHLLEAYLVAEINGKIIGLDPKKDDEGNLIVPTTYEHTIKVLKDLLWVNSSAVVPVIGTTYQDFVTTQYTTLNIPITVYDPQDSTPEVVVKVDGVEQMKKTLTDSNTFEFPYRPTETGEDEIVIECGSKQKVLNAKIKAIDIGEKPSTAGLVFDFVPAGRNNDQGNRTWEYTTELDGVSKTTKLLVSPNFDWINGGYQIEKDQYGQDIPGTEHFCVKAGTQATFNCALFGDNAASLGKNFKTIFKTTNIKNRDTSFLSCFSNNIGLDMKVENAIIGTGSSSKAIPYSEDDIIEFEFNINTRVSGKPYILIYEDGVPFLPLIYGSGDVMQHSDEVYITIGSPDCDVLIYRMKTYNRALPDEDILRNFIFDARTADEMIDRYERNRIYTNGSVGNLTPDSVYNACPDLRIIEIETPSFTNSKDKVGETNIKLRYKNGNGLYDWTCVDGEHCAQGTSSMDYGYAGYNIDLVLNGADAVLKNSAGEIVENVQLDSNTVPVNYFNVKVNIASSENTNNAQLTKFYDRFNPFIRSRKLKDTRVKDTMDFYNCVVFIKETGKKKKRDENGNPIFDEVTGEQLYDTIARKEFNDDAWHFYAIGNIGDSKKTDKTRVDDPNDVKECIVEIEDVDVPLCGFSNERWNWEEGETDYDLNNTDDNVYGISRDEDGEIDKFGRKSFSFRYKSKQATDVDQINCVKAWKKFYDFVATSTPEKFKEDLHKWFVVDSALYYYLFTERYTMVDNRAKNSFWHYSKVYYKQSEADKEFTPAQQTKYCKLHQYIIPDEEWPEGDDGYRWDLSFGYDMDTALGIDNTGDMVFSYGKEDIDSYSDIDTREVFRISNSVFFVNLRNQFSKELGTIYDICEKEGAWSADNLISIWDKKQAEFPEELWRKDIERKYIRTYLGASIDASIPTGPITNAFEKKFFGRKKYQRRAFERNQEMYMATKYGSSFVQEAIRRIYIRGSAPVDYDPVDGVPNYNIELTPYSNMYLCYKIGSTGDVVSRRVWQGKAETIIYPTGKAPDFIYIYGANFIQSIKDLSLAYLQDAEFSAASRLQTLTLGRDIRKTEVVSSAITSNLKEDGKTYEYFLTETITNIDANLLNVDILNVDTQLNVDKKDFELISKNGKYSIIMTKQFGKEELNGTITFTLTYNVYKNPALTSVGIGANKMLEALDLKNVSGLNSPLNLSQCFNLKTFNAEGTQINDITFANGGRLQSATLPNVTNLILQNLRELNNLSIKKTTNLNGLIVDNCPGINSYDIVNNAINLTRLRLTNIDWTGYNIPNANVFDRALKMFGYDANGVGIDSSVITGAAHVLELKKSQQTAYDERWGEQLTITYNHLINQVQATFVNHNGEVLDTQNVDWDSPAVDPTTRQQNPIEQPTKPSTVEFDYEFIGWSPETFANLIDNQVYKAVFEPKSREYTVTYTGTGVEPYSVTKKYGEVVEFEGSLPTPTIGSGTYSVFTGWNKSGYVNGNKEIAPNFDTCQYSPNYFSGKSFKTLRPVELFMLSDLVNKGSLDLSTLGYFGDDQKYTFKMGHDLNYTKDIGSNVLTDNTTHYVSKEGKLNETGVKLFDSDKPFVLAIDFSVKDQNNNEATLIQCHNGGTSGFRVKYTKSNNAAIVLEWGEGSSKILSTKAIDGSSFAREMLVLERRRGEKDLRYYFSNKMGNEIVSGTLTGLQLPSTHELEVVIGGRKTAAGKKSDFIDATVYWCKVWHGAIGDKACRQLASWPHEELTMSLVYQSGNNDAILPISYSYGETGTTELVFLSEYLLERAMGHKTYYTGSTEGGWGASEINKYLNTRVYNGFPEEIRGLIKMANVKSGYWENDWTSGKNQVKNFPSYLFIPAYKEVYSGASGIYAEEAGSTFGPFVQNSDRVCKTTEGVAQEYWLRTPDNYNKNYFYYVANDGSVKGDYGDEYKYIRPMLII